MHRFAYLDHPGPIAFAHRGGAGDWPENTMPAFDAAVALGYRYLETDVHVTADGEVVAFHDDSLDRVTDGHGRIRDHTWSHLRQLRVGGREPMCLLRDLLDSFPQARFNIDPKHDDVVPALAEVIRSAGAVERVCIASFSDRRIAELQGLLGPRVCTGLGPRGIARLRGASIGLPAGTFTAGCVQVPERAGRVPIVDRSFLRAAHARSLAVHVWTIDDAPTMERLLDLGVDGIMTDRPAILREVLVARGQW